MNFFVVTLFSFFLAVQASPLFAPRTSLDVWVPHITSPIESTVWHIGADVIVTWNTNDAPVNITNKRASIYLDQDTTPPIRILLVEGFDLRSGSQTVKVPSNIKHGQYYITLFGDSGNYSPVFSIEAI